jgi:NAD+ diphosphatase
MSRAFQSTLPLARLAIDRDHAARTDEALLDARWADPGARVIVLRRGQALARRDAEGTTGLDLRVPAELPAAALAELADGGVRLYLGLSQAVEEGGAVGVAFFAISVTDAAAGAFEADGAEWVNLRIVAEELDHIEAATFTEALAVFNWHATHRHCPRCGAASTVESGGWVRRCPVENIELFPRTDPAIIVGVIGHDDRILLGSNALWENNRYSLLAGFVEPGESLEAAAIREIGEESGVVIDDPEYVGSQPWPFPASLMVGFMARVAEGEADTLQPDGEEILDLKWFSRDDLAASHGGVILPGRASIARAIIERWFGGPLPEPEAW